MNVLTLRCYGFHSDVKPFDEAGHVPVEYSARLKDTCFDQFYHEECVRSYLDNLNLLYVGFTRAEQALLVMAPHPKKVKVSRVTVWQSFYLRVSNAKNHLSHIGIQTDWCINPER